MTDIHLTIDSHEYQFLDALKSDYLQKECGHVKFEIETLDVGDFLYKRQGQPICLIERKAVSDWVGSITDKRSKNQTLRILQLKKEYPNLIVIFLIEGAFVTKDYKFRGHITRNILYSSMIHRIIRDQCTVYHSADIYDTALIITKIYDQLTDQLDLTAQTQTPTTERVDYLKTIQLAPKDNLTPLNCYVCQLAQITGVSIETGNQIAQTYSSMKSLILAYERTPFDQRESLLSEIILPIANQKTKRLGLVLSKRIYEYLCPPEPIKKIAITLKKV